MMFELLIGSLSMMMLFMILTVLFLTKTPAIAFLKASMSGKPLIQIYRRDRTSKFITAKFDAGICKTKDDGYYVTTPESVYVDGKSGVRMLAAFQDSGVTVPPELPEMARQLKEAGIETVEEADAVDNELRKDNKELSVTIQGHTLNFGWLRNWIKHNMNPFVIQSILEKEKAATLKEQNAVPYKWISAIAVLLVAGAVAAFIVYSFIGTGGGGPITVNMDPNSLADAIVAAQTKTAASASPPIIG